MRDVHVLVVGILILLHSQLMWAVYVGTWKIIRQVRKRKCIE